MTMDTSGSGRRKRERSLENPDEDFEFMPLSKRITCLNLNPASEEARERERERSQGQGQGQGQGQESSFGQNIGHSGGPSSQGSSGGRGNGSHSHSHSSLGSEPYGSSLSDSQSSSQSLTDYTYMNTRSSSYDDNSTDCEMNGESQPNGFHGSSTVFQHTPNGVMGGNGLVGVSMSGYGSPNNAFLYEPSLDELSNPHYYEQNRHLFDLYLERMQRNHLTPHPYLLRVREEMDSHFRN